MLFRLHLKANKVPGLEKAYLQYTLLVDVIEKGTFSNGDNASEVSSSSPSIHRILMRSRSMGASQGADAALLEAPLLEEEMGAGWQQSTESERRALMVSRLLWVELQRVDAFCRETVQDMEFLANHISNQLASQREANLLERRATLEHTLAVCELMESNARQSQDNALRLMYKNCFLMMQVASLNYVGFRKVIKKARKRLGKEACDAAGMPDTDQLKSHAFYLEKHETSAPEAARFFANVEHIEGIYAREFTDGDQERARGILRALRRPPPKRKEVVFTGALMGANAVLLVWSAWLLLLPNITGAECPYCNDYLLATIPAFRVLLVPVVWAWLWAFCCKIWEDTSINYIYVMDCDQRTALCSSKSFHLAGAVCTALLAAFVAYVGALRTQTYVLVPPMLYPLFLLIFAAFSLLAPPFGNGFAKTRSYFMGCLFRSAFAPLFEVRFRENFVADVMTSMVVILRDIAAMVFFYLEGGATGMTGAANANEYYDLAILFSGPLITALPYWWRLMQCLRRWHDTPHHTRMSTLHLVNAGKYLVSLTSICLAAVGCQRGCSHFYFDKEKWTIGRIAWFSCLCTGTVYSYAWDILMDWSLIEWVPKEGRWPLGTLRLRRDPKTCKYQIRFYIFAIFSNLVGRLMWAFSIEPNIRNYGLSPQVFTTIVAVVEVVRRGQWALLRLENEHISNASNYRSVADVPLMVELAERQLGARGKLGVASTGLLHRACSVCTSLKGVGLMLITMAFASAAVYVIMLASRM